MTGGEGFVLVSNHIRRPRIYHVGHALDALSSSPPGALMAQYHAIPDACKLIARRCASTVRRGSGAAELVVDGRTDVYTIAHHSARGWSNAHKGAGH
jgi:hypothetical protein